MTLRDWAARTSPHYGEIRAPVVIVAGTDDKAVDYRGHSVRLHHDIPGSRLHIWPNTGHMVHHSRTEEVIESIEEVFEMADDRSAGASAGSGVAERPPRQRRPSSPPREAVPSRPCPGGEVVFRLLTEHRLQIAAGVAIQPREKTVGQN